MEPPTTCPTLGRSFMMERPTVVLPQPDSPTTPTHSPASTLNDTSSTARTLELLRRTAGCSPSTSRTRLTESARWSAGRAAPASNCGARPTTLTGNRHPRASRRREELALARPAQVPTPWKLTHEGPAMAVDRRGPVAAQCGLMHGRGIALVALEGVRREVVRLLTHQPVPDDLGQDRGGRHRRALGVTVDNGAYLPAERIVGMAQQIDRPVDQERLRRLAEAGQGAPGRDPQRLGHAP